MKRIKVLKYKMHWFRTGILFLITFALDAVASDQMPAKPQEHPIALVGGAIHIVSGATIAEGTVLFIDGKITAVGTQVELPEDAEQINIAGKHVYPGLILANTRLGLLEIAAVRSTRDFAESGDIKPNIRAEVSVNPDSELLPVTRANGITMAHTIPMGGLISGTSAMITLDGWTWEDLTVKAPVGLFIDWPSMGAPESPTITEKQKKQLKARDKKLAKISGTFAEARAYLKAKDAESQKGMPYHATDLRLDALIPVLKQEVPVLLHAHGIKQIQTGLDWAIGENLKVILLCGQDVRFAIDMIKEKNIPVIYEGTLAIPTRRWEAYDTPFTVPLKLFEAGVTFCIAGSGGPFAAAHERNLPYQAAMAAAYGLPKAEALKTVTLYPAQILGVADRVGSIEVGKDATLIITNGDPLEIMTQVEKEFIQGRKIDLTSRHTQLYEKYKTKYERMGLTKNKTDN